MRSAGRFFVGRSSAEHRDGAIKSTSTLPPSGTLSMFSCPLCLILSYRVYTAAVLVALNIFFHPYPSSPSSYLISFVVTITSPLYNIFAAAFSIAPHLHRRIYCHPFSDDEYIIIRERMDFFTSCTASLTTSTLTHISPTAIIIRSHQRTSLPPTSFSHISSVTIIILHHLTTSTPPPQ